MHLKCVFFLFLFFHFVKALEKVGVAMPSPYVPSVGVGTNNCILWLLGPVAGASRFVEWRRVGEDRKATQEPGPMCLFAGGLGGGALRVPEVFAGGRLRGRKE